VHGLRPSDTPDPNDHAPALWADGKGRQYHFNGLSAPDGVIHLISSWNHYALNLAWLKTPAPL